MNDTDAGTAPITFATLRFSELFTSQGLNKLDQIFLAQLKQYSSSLCDDLLAYRNGDKTFTPETLSELLINCAIQLEKLMIDFFEIEEAAAIVRIKTTSENPISIFKKFYILRKAKKQLAHSDKLPDFAELNNWLNDALQTSELQSEDSELSIALLGVKYLEDTEKYKVEIEKLTQWCIHGLITPEANLRVKNWVSFRIPERIDYANLIPTTLITHDDKYTCHTLDKTALRLRDGFKLTDTRMSIRGVQDEVNYCIYCHDHNGDFCSKGFPVKKGDPSQGLKKNALDNILTGCPLEEKISEMNILKRDGYTLAALAVVMIDNPMCPATGHRICNDCMKACIYQKQEPVNIPQIETRVLDDVLHLPYGVEIYDLLTRWNPLRQTQWVMKPYNGLKVMIAGMGPAGFTLAHHLLLEGFAVVGFDGLKIEPLSNQLLTQPIARFDDLKEALDERLMSGFGGVAEYGITVRWDKNFLKLIYISLCRKPHFQVFGSARFGGTVTVDDAWTLGFDHFVIAVGAGLPKALSIPGSLAPGMRQANDFLMALQLGNAAKKGSLTNLQIRLPAVIIGGGLTGVDTATEVQAYYITQVEKILTRYEKLVSAYDEKYIRQHLNIASTEILEEFLRHGRLVREERQQAINENRFPNFIKLIREWGGVTIAYRRRMQDSPAYVNNHEELKKALEEGIYFAEMLEPHTAILNQHGAVETLVCYKRSRTPENEWETTLEEVKLPARAIFVATGTQPNIAYEFEHKGTFARLGFQYQHYENKNGELSVSHGVVHCKEPDFGPFTSYHHDDHFVTLIGDTHPVFHGSVVKAIASGLRTYPKIVASLQHKLKSEGDTQEYIAFAERMKYLFSAKIIDVTRRTPEVVELLVQAPLAAKKFEPGHFFRLQNYETFCTVVEDTILQMEPLALIAADVHNDILKFIVIETGTSSKICASLKIHEPISLMGPTGIRNKIATEHETILIAGNQLSIALLLSYGKALKAAGNKVIYVGYFNDASQVYCQEQLEKAADVIIWITTHAPHITCNREQDYVTQLDPVSALVQYANGTLHTGKQALVSLSDVDRIFLVGNSHFLKSFQEARHTQLKEFFVKQPKVSGSVYSTMQCMLKGVCAQCLQWQIDPETGKRTKAVFACSWPDQPLEIIDFDNIDERLSQNQLQETLGKLWLDHLYLKAGVERV